MPDLRPFSDVSWTDALSRLHPMILHLPIAIFVVLLLVELPRLFRRHPVQRDSTRSVLVALLFLTAPITAASGYFLAASDSYGSPVEWHQRLGITTAIVAMLVGIAYWRRSEHYPLLVVLGAVLIALTAHLGATLTHGKDFLIEPWLVEKPHTRRALPTAESSAAPQIETETMQAVPTTDGASPEAAPPTTHPDGPGTPTKTPSAATDARPEAGPTTGADTAQEAAPPVNANLLEDLMPATAEEPTGLVPKARATPEFMFDRDVLPIFEDFCFKCHAEAKQKGELRLDSYDGLLAGSEYGSVFIPGNAAESRLTQMLRLDLMEDEHMPPENKPQPEDADIAAIEAWIDSQ